MKALYVLACIQIAVMSYLLADLASRPPPAAPEPVPEVQHDADVWRPTLFPEQTRAVEDLLGEILARQKDLDGKEALLKEREDRVRQEEILLIRMRDELTSAQQALEAHFKDWDKDEQANVKKLADFFTRMDAQNAARLLSEMETARAARILVLLQDRQAGAIMDAAVTLGDAGIERAVVWSEIIRQLKKDRVPEPKETVP